MCTGGTRAAPPEDCGGPQAFFEHLRAASGDAHDQLAQHAEATRAGDLDALGGGVRAAGQGNRSRHADEAGPGPDRDRTPEEDHRNARRGK